MKKKGFTLIELLAVIIILAVIALIATPIVLNVIDNARESARKSSVNGYADATRMAIYDYQFANNGSYPTVDKIWAESNAKTKGDTVNCEEVHFSTTYEVVLHKCNVGSNEKKYCHANGKTYEDCENEEYKNIYDNLNKKEKPVKNCTFDGEMIQGAEFVDGQYVYRYMQQGTTNGGGFENIDEDGWGVKLVNSIRFKTEPITTKMCTAINGKPIVSMQGMFSMSQATEIDLSSFDTSNVTNMSHMFFNSKVTTLNVENFDTSKVTDMSYMFSTSSITNDLDLRHFNVINVVSMQAMFMGAPVNINLEGWTNDKVEDMSSMFSGVNNVNLKNFKTHNVNDMTYMFHGFKGTHLDLSSFDTSNVTNMNGMFQLSSLENLDLNNFNTSKVTNMAFMLSNLDGNLKNLNISSLDTSNVTDMQGMFCETRIKNLDLSNFNTSKVETMNSMFRAAEIETLDLSSFDTNNVTNMNEMFRDSKITTGYAKTQADADKFNTSSEKPENLNFIVK